MTRARTRKRARSSAPKKRPGPGKGRKPGQTSPAIAKAAREAGKLGGRPPARLPKEMLEALGPPPEDITKKDAWFSRAIEVVTFGVLKGEPWKSLLETTIRAAAQATKTNEREIKARLVELLEREERETKEDYAPRSTPRDEDPIGKANRGALRRDPT